MILVTGAGRSGTTLTTAHLRAHPDITVYEGKEDRKLFKRHLSFPYAKHWATKLTVEWFKLDTFRKWYDTREDFKVVYCVRHPKDVVLSKIRRGHPAKYGGDRSDNKFAKDATFSGCLCSLSRTQELWEIACEIDEKRIFPVKLEELITKQKDVCEDICSFLGVAFKGEMLDGPKNLHDKWKQKRYGDSLANSQVNLHTNWKEVYDGFFKDRLVAADLVQRIWDTQTIGYISGYWRYDVN